MKITKEWLKEKRACDGGMDWFEKEVKEASEFDAVIVLIIMLLYFLSNKKQAKAYCLLKLLLQVNRGHRNLLY